MKKIATLAAVIGTTAVMTIPAFAAGSEAQARGGMIFVQNTGLTANCRGKC